ncbi:uncharacterized protein I303_106473 [Kwoniella dejecticola CBS 10117]|uniref:Uncharacterized protein n=1 Tax=Kwoniella dejecticola CBS 10117 TaxID=1296121 RepID=A0A1A5ZUL7_9TREE|nr:uncharacterized protein I303_08269 [Kwoniella dejecticola CBS 10117]OBR81499.1 hypothetical protein I303_08269 [Kwoniella dejecticola CBS 10117]
MPAPPSISYATISSPLPAKPYILSITPSPTKPHLILRHPGPDLTIIDNQTLQSVERLTGGHQGNVTSVIADQDALWSSAKDGSIVRWDERSKRAGTIIQAAVRKAVPVTALAISERDHLVIGGTELLSSEAHIIYWDDRHPSKPLYLHSSTHSDDITHLSLLPPTPSFARPSPSSSSGVPFPDKLLLSASTDGLIALSNPKDLDEDEAVIATENWNQSIADSKAYLHKGKMKVCARSDMDLVSTWDIGLGAEGELELHSQVEYPSSSFRFKSFKPPPQGPTVTQTASEEMESKLQLKSDYLIDVVPSLGISKAGGAITAVGTNDGDIILQHHVLSTSTATDYAPSAYFLSGPSKARGHKDVIRALYHDLNSEAIYTGSEDGVVSGWNLASLPDKLIVGDDEIDMSGDEDEDMDQDDQSEESEIVTEEEEEESDKSDDEMNNLNDEDEGPRYGPILGAGAGRTQESRKEKRKGNRFGPY